MYINNSFLNQFQLVALYDFKIEMISYWDGSVGRVHLEWQRDIIMTSSGWWLSPFKNMLA